ncbi:MAG: DHH family phosphoesterase [Lachnospiraceae bacterium]|nr:DHH family phosphoesterase [Lachnospiraceae bacterium]
MRLHDLLTYDDIVVQCHNNPDADAIASGFGVYTYLKNMGKKVSLVYGGSDKIQKANLRLMVETLQIPIAHVESLDMPQLLITVDCQYGEGNVAPFEAANIAIIDHHQQAVTPPALCEIRSNLGSCATLVWDMLKAEGMDINGDKPLSTALYYGLLTDTNNFTEISHPLDKDLRDDALFDRNLITRFRNTNLSLTELVIAGKALIDYQYNEKYRFSVVQAEPCDPNILGMISDLVLEVDVVDVCVVYSVLPRGIKLSVRSCIKEAKACDVVQAITEGIGSGGGHLVKAGGFINRTKLDCRDEDISTYFIGTLQNYFANTEIIVAKDYNATLSEMQLYRKLSLPLGYVKINDIISPGSPINIRTLEGDFDIIVEKDMYIVIGIWGEIYPIRREKFEKSYMYSEEEYVFCGEYPPTIKDTLSGNSISLIPYAKSCISTGGSLIYASTLDHLTKVFTAWDEEKYMLGRPGDYLAIRKDDLQDVYIIRRDIFSETYQKA